MRINKANFKIFLAISLILMDSTTHNIINRIQVQIGGKPTSKIIFENY